MTCRHSHRISMRLRWGLPIVSVVVTLLALTCSTTPTRVGDGTGSETPNTFTLAVAAGRIECRPVSTLSISLHKASYVPYYDVDTLRSDLDFRKDDHGSYVSGRLPGGYYNVLARDTVGGRAAFVDSLFVDSSTSLESTVVALAKPLRLSGTLIDTVSTPAKQHIVYVKGSPFYATTSISGEFELSTIPPGNYRLLGMPLIDSSDECPDTTMSCPDVATKEYVLTDEFTAEGDTDLGPVFPQLLY